MQIFKQRVRPDYKGSAKKYRELYYEAQKTISDLDVRWRYMKADRDAKADTIAKLKGELNELRIKYSEALNENVRLLERMKAYAEVQE